MERARIEIVVPEEANERGPIFFGEIQSKELKIPSILAQLSGISPYLSEASVHFYPTLEQAKALFEARSPFTFEGSLSLDGKTRMQYSSTEVWLKNGSVFKSHDLECFTGCSGRLADLKLTYSAPGEPSQEPGTAYFVSGGCHLFQVLATLDDDIALARNQGVQHAYKFTLSDGAVAEISRVLAERSQKREKTTTKRAYAVRVESVKNAEVVSKDIQGLYVLASLASRERCDFSYWSVKEPGQQNIARWRFGFGKWPPRPKGEVPIVRNALLCADFLKNGLERYSLWRDTAAFDAAVFVLLSRNQSIETKIVNLYTALQRILVQSLSLPTSSQLKVRELFELFSKRFPIDISDLWPLSDTSMGASLNRIRNELVHGKVFTSPKDFQALGIAAENLCWIVERVLLAMLDWNVEDSAVSARYLALYTAHQWTEAQRQIVI